MVTAITSFRSGMSSELVDEEWFLYGIGFSRQLIRKATSTELSCSGTAQLLVHVLFAPEQLCRHCQGTKLPLVGCAGVPDPGYLWTDSLPEIAKPFWVPDHMPGTHVARGCALIWMHCALLCCHIIEYLLDTAKKASVFTLREENRCFILL